jgi:hypothetical protein
MKKTKPYWEMNTAELAEATKEFDDPTYAPTAVKATAAQRAQLRRWQRKRIAARSRLTLSLDKGLIEQTDNYAVNRGITFSDVVSDALRRLMHTKPA